ncbi:MAG: hypothetical protein ACK56I_33185, partial [bacterium]
MAVREMKRHLGQVAAGRYDELTLQAATRRSLASSALRERLGKRLPTSRAAGETAGGAAARRAGQAGACKSRPGVTAPPAGGSASEGRVESVTSQQIQQRGSGRLARAGHGPAEFGELVHRLAGDLAQRR